MKPGPELDERVSKLLGWEPTLRWGVGKRAEHSWTYYGMEWQCRDWFARHRELHPEHAAGMEVYCIESWPAVSTDGNAMLRAIDAMRERGWDGFKVETMGDMSRNRVHWQKEGLWYCWFSGQRGIKMRGGFHGESPQHAVALAICSALESESEGK